MFDIFDIFDNSDFFQIPTQYREEVRCPICGQTYSDFNRTGKLGCSECYKTFAAPISSVLKQIHQNPHHVGKIPRNLSTKISAKRKLELLRSQLKAAVDKEDYETAAKLHKEITEIEKG